MRTSLSLGALLILGSAVAPHAAVAATASSSTTLSAAEMTDLKAEIAHSTPLSVIKAPVFPMAWKRTSPSSSSSSGVTASPFPGGTAVFGAGLDPGNEPVQVILTAEGLNTVASDVVPTLAKAYGLSSVSLDDETLADWECKSIPVIQPCDNFHRIRLEGVTFKLPLDASSVQLTFQSGNRLAIKLRESDASMSATIAHEKKKTDCNDSGGWETEQSVTATAKGLSLDANVTFAMSGSSINITTINSMSVSISDVDISSSFLTYLLNLGIDAAHVLGADCSSIESCLSTDITNYVAGDEILRDKILDAINAAVEKSVTVLASSTYTDGTYSVGYTAGMSDLDTDGSGNLVSTWGVGVWTPATASCGSAVTYTQRTGRAESIGTSGDLDVVAPMWLIEKVLAVLGMQGAFCATSSITVDGVSGGNARCTIQPNGMITVSGTALSGTESIAFTIRSPVKVSAYAKFGGLTYNADGTATVALSGSAFKKNNGVSIQLKNADVSGLTGSLKGLSLSTFEGDLESAINSQIAGKTIPVIPQATSIGDYLSVSVSGLNYVGGVVTKTGLKLAADLSAK